MGEADRRCLITIRKSLGNLPTAWQDQVVQTIVAKAECDALNTSLQRIYVFESEAGLELEFWFRGCTQSEASQCAAAAIRDAAEVEQDPSAATPSAWEDAG